jgi:hypothetical protein
MSLVFPFSSVLLEISLEVESLSFIFVFKGSLTFGVY